MDFAGVIFKKVSINAGSGKYDSYFQRYFYCMFYISSVAMGEDACTIPHSEKYKEVYPPCETLVAQMNHHRKMFVVFHCQQFW